MEKKTQLDVLNEYKNRQDNPEYKWIGVSEDSGQYEQFSNVSNVQNTKDELGLWLEFDTKARHKSTHIKLHGPIVKYEQLINE